MTQSQNNSNRDDELLSAYIDGELTDAERAAVETRLETDPAARELVAEMRSLSGTLKSLPRESLAEDLRGAVLNQIGDRGVSLPPVKLSMARRVMWPAIAIAAALMLMFVQGNEKTEIDKVASARGQATERRERDLADEGEAAFEAPVEETTTVAPAAPAPTTGGRLTDAEADAPPADAAIAGTAIDETAGESAVAARRMTEALAESDAELEGVVHLTLTDFHSGAERFNRLLVSNGVQLVDQQPTAGEIATAAAPATAAPMADGYEAQGAGTMSTRRLAPAGGLGGTAPSAPTEGSRAVSQPEFVEPEMVLVEAPPEQIEQILLGCSQDMEAIEDVTVDPTASGMNSVPAQQRLADYQQYSRSSGKLALGSEYKVTPEQQGVISVLNSLPKEIAPAVQTGENQEQSGWAARLNIDQLPVQNAELNSQYNQYRNRYFDNQARQQQAIAKDEIADTAQKLSKKAAIEEPLRVLFLLHPSQEPAKK